MTLLQWCATHSIDPNYLPTGAVYVPSAGSRTADSLLYRLADYMVSSAVGGPGFILCPKSGPKPQGSPMDQASLCNLRDLLAEVLREDTEESRVYLLAAFDLVCEFCPVEGEETINLAHPPVEPCPRGWDQV